MRALPPAALVGMDDREIVTGRLECPVHAAVVAPFEALRRDAAAAGFRLRIASGYRSFERQLAIFNGKAEGRRPVLDDGGRVIDSERLDEWSLLLAILRWSALPGASRHHWGSDLDVYDAAAVPADYQLLLTAEEAADDGPFGPLHRWLDERIAAGKAAGFYRPYHSDRGGVAPERWHLSYAPLAAPCAIALTATVLAQNLADKPLALKSLVLERLDELYQRFVVAPGPTAQNKVMTV